MLLGAAAAAAIDDDDGGVAERRKGKALVETLLFLFLVRSGGVRGEKFKHFAIDCFRGVMAVRCCCCCCFACSLWRVTEFGVLDRSAAPGAPLDSDLRST